jgi:regulator of cell morphogenesis and NO signaling
MKTDLTTTISPEMTVNEVAQLYPSTRPVFQQLGMDFCCGGNRAIEEVTAAHGLELEAVLHSLRVSASAEP